MVHETNCIQYVNFHTRNKSCLDYSLSAPLAPAILIVEITPNGGGDTVAGDHYTLTCTVTVPESSGLSGALTVVWTGDERKTGVTEGTPDTSGRNTTLTLTFNPLRDSQDGNYTCMATFSCQDVTDQTASVVRNLDVVGMLYSA